MRAGAVDGRIDLADVISGIITLARRTPGKAVVTVVARQAWTSVPGDKIPLFASLSGWGLKLEVGAIVLRYGLYKTYRRILDWQSLAGPRVQVVASSFSPQVRPIISPR